MCGLAGVSGTVDREALQRASWCLRHRGPDGDGIFIDESRGIGLAHRRLAIQDLTELAQQPMRHEPTGCVLAYNGEIYNVADLREDLRRRGVHVRSSGDTEVLLNLLVLDGADCFERLDGMFALAFFDPRDRSVLLTRDGVGIKPLYVAELSDRFAFASEMAAVRRLLTAPPSVDHVAVAQYLTFLWTPGERTPLEQVKKLSPGEALVVRDGRIVSRIRWYRPPLHAVERFDASTNDELIIDELRQELRRSVHGQLLSDAPVGAFLSGGLDSSTVVALAAERNPELPCFTIRIVDRPNGEGFVDDLPYAREVARELALPLHEVPISRTMMEEDFADAVRAIGEPLADLAPLNVRYISSAARGMGIKVLLSGAGGDDIFTGYRRHSAVAVDRLVRRAPLPALRVLERVGLFVPPRGPLLRRLRKFTIGLAEPDDLRTIAAFRWLEAGPTADLLHPDLVASLDGHDIAAPMLAHLSAWQFSDDRLDRMLALEQRFFLNDHNLAYTDRMSMAEGVEVRVPLLADALMRKAARLPDRLRMRRGVGKQALRRVARGVVPAGVLSRPKSGFGAPVRDWVGRTDSALVERYLDPSVVGARGIYSVAGVRSAVEQTRSGSMDASYPLLGTIAMEIVLEDLMQSVRTDCSDGLEEPQGSR
jgi:asparagine synthase (glutamine-hydrolysing)